MKKFIIAEAGSNHNGDIEKAFQLVDIAKKANADSVKFQFIYADGLYLPEYNLNSKCFKSGVHQKRKKEELSDDEWKKVWDYSKNIGIDISASVFCTRGVSLLKNLGCTYVKIASTDLTNHKLIKEVSQNFDHVLISTGMSSIDEISDSVNRAKRSNSNINLKLMHCVSLYPCPFKNSNLSRINELQNKFGLEVGYSDHTEDIRSAILASAKGVDLFEKHFTYDKSQAGFDHAHAQDPTELMLYIKTLNECNEADKWTESKADQEAGEEITKIRARRGVYISKDLPSGHLVKEDDLLYVRPSTSFMCTDPDEFIGLRVHKSIKKYTAIGIKSDLVIEVSSNWSAANDFWEEEMREKNMDNN